MFGTPRLGVRARFLALALVAVVGCALMAVLIYDRAAKATFQMRESQARAAVQDTLGALRPLLAEAARGTLSLVEAQAEVRSRIATTRFHAPMTVFALDPETGVVAHGPSPGFVGSDRPEHIDIAPQALQAAQANGGLLQGSLLHTPRASPAGSPENLSVLQELGAWNWMIAAEISTHDLATSLAALRQWAILVFLATATITILCAIALGHGISQPLQQIARELQSLEIGELEAPQRRISRPAFFATLSRSLETLRDTLRQQRDAHLEAVARDHAEKAALQRVHDQECHDALMVCETDLPALSAGLRKLAAGDFAPRLPRTPPAPALM